MAEASRQRPRTVAPLVLPTMPVRQIAFTTSRPRIRPLGMIGRGAQPRRCISDGLELALSIATVQAPTHLGAGASLASSMRGRLWGAATWTVGLNAAVNAAARSVAGRACR